ncbi:ribose-phosphate diphosphokinase [Lapidilactobacillus wuchangensis]|uniref:ribose-phosphate diphosphokinase n=1 Tax=Lapidilactobacillus wuchangensis TaxID=2486001 RepID=UPI000F78BEF0|nr:ribose-phosphate pyrophosphokinase [Lapidilactobacillus wuchangensis]
MATRANNRHAMRLIALNGNYALAEAIAKAVGTPLLSTSVKHFADGEIQINIDETVRGDDIFVIQSVDDPVNENFMELMIMLDALRRASAHTINVVMPYYAYSRADRKTRSREPITAKLVSNLIECGGADRVIALDLHADQIQGFFDIPVDHLQGLPLLAKYFEKKHLDDKDDIVVVAPDHNSTKRARALAEYLNAPIAIVDKRDSSPSVDPLDIIGDVDGRICIIADDLIDTANRMVWSANSLKAAGAKAVYGCATHAVFSKGAPEKLQESIIEQVVVTDSIRVPEEKEFPKLVRLSVADLFANAIERIYNNESIHDLFDGKH